MRLVIIGPQGSGKGTQSDIISEKLSLPHISTGNLLRNATGEVGRQVSGYMLKGDLVPDELILIILKERLSWPDCKKGFILDGYPRTLAQAKALAKVTKIDKVIMLSVSESLAIKRIQNRLVCLYCGHNYNKLFNPPQKENVCDHCGHKLSSRVDDTKKAIKHRLEIYHKDTEPLIKYYKAVRIDGGQETEKVTQEILNVVKKLKTS